MKHQVSTLSVYKAAVLVGISFVMSACSLAPKMSELNIPDALYFEQEYEASPANMALQSKARYLAWIEQFYQGSMLQPQGWLDVVQNCVDSVPEAQQADVETRASELGRRIAAEWAKDNSVRKITTRHVSVWGLALREAIEKGELISLFEQVGDDVDALISGQLDAYAVNSERYYEPEYNEFF